MAADYGTRMATTAGVTRGTVTTQVERPDRWWLEPVAIVSVLGLFVLYSAWAGLVNAHYYSEPYLSPFYSPCITSSCPHVTFGVPFVGDWWGFSPAVFIVGFPLVFRLTCYYYRRSYYRAFFWAPPACTVPDARAKYAGETRFPFILQNLHRYTWYLAVPIWAILTYDAVLAFIFPTPDHTGFRLGVGLGSLIMLANVAFIGLYTFSCHSCRYLCGGYLDRFRGAPIRYRLWNTVNRLNTRHGLFAWLSLFSVGLTDLYIRIVSMGWLVDPRIVF
ncbi:MAG: hypothetical protein H0V71_00375 [Chloroflexi bacterium]|nr:hypothetical protein [Chloroflexota bacterium]